MANVTASSDAANKSAELKQLLLNHLSAQYNIIVSQVSSLDQEVFRVDRQDGPSWVARIFGSSQTIQVVESHAEILRFLENEGFPAERLAHAEPVSTTTTGHHVLVTEFVEGRRPRKGEQLFPKLGDLLGRLNTMVSPTTEALARRGGAWHHICHEGGPGEEINAALDLLKESKSRVFVENLELYEHLHSKLEQVDVFEQLPQAFIHPDFVPSNVITSNDGNLIVVDWAGAGTGPRISTLGFLLWAAGHRSMAQVEAVVSGYSKHVKLEQEELARLAAAISFRPLVLRCWEFCTGRTGLKDARQRLSAMEDFANRIASTARIAFENQGASQTSAPSE